MFAEITWVDAAKGVADIVQALALLVGAVWAYFKFVRGRTLAYRGQLSISAARIGAAPECALYARIIFENTGGSQIPLSLDAKIVRVYATTSAGMQAGHSVDWREKLLATEVFSGHAWVEPQEPIGEELLLPVPETIGSEPVLAYLVECVLGSKRRRGQAIKWTAKALVLGALEHGSEERSQVVEAHAPGANDGSTAEAHAPVGASSAHALPSASPSGDE